MPADLIIQIRGGTTAQWAAANPVLAARELGVELDAAPAPKLKIGNGVDQWSDLPYVAYDGGAGVVFSVNGQEGVIELAAADVGAEPAGLVAAHVALPDPHNQYQLKTGKDVAGGYAGLDDGGKLLAAQIPALDATDALMWALIFGG